MAKSFARWVVAAMVCPLAVAQSLRAPSHSDTALHNSRFDVVATYERLSALPADALKQQYRYMPASMQEDVWTLHIERFMERHPALTQDQRAVLFEALGLLANGIIEQNGTSDRNGVIEALGRLEYRAKMMLPPDLAREALAELADGAPLQAGPPSRRGELRAFSGTPECDCSGDSDWCNMVTNPTPKCKAANCTMVDGCGTFWLYVCDGLCSTIP